MSSARRRRARLSGTVITERGYGKKTPVEEYRITNGAASASRTTRLRKKPAMWWDEGGDRRGGFAAGTQSGIMIRTGVESIRSTGRSTQGVIVMRFKEEGDSVISLALADKDENDD